MVAPDVLSLDISAVAISTALPGAAWAMLFALAWRYPTFAESLGLGRRAFWLLLPGALLASFALLPLTPVSNDILAVSFAGAVFPLAVGILTLERVAPPLRRTAARLFAFLGGETALLLAVVLLADAGRLGANPWPAELALVAGLAAAVALVAIGVEGREGTAAGRAVAGLVGLTTVTLVLTFATARAIPGVGISEGFPYYLIPPMVAGALAVLAAPLIVPGQEGFALPIGFFVGGWGVVLGADVLWEPPLYVGGPSGLYAIGGAGVLDLVYLSAFLGLLAAWGSHRLLGRGYAPVGAPLPHEPVSPTGRLREAYVRGVEGATNASLEASAGAARAAALQARRLLGQDPTVGGRPWDGLAVPGWVVSDQANLDGVARAGSTDPREAVRAWVTARALVRLGAHYSQARFASLLERLVAFVIDVALLAGLGAAVFVAIVAATPGGLDGALSSVALNTGIYAFVAFSLLYFALTELWTGATVGKWILRIEVRDRALRPVSGLASFLRNSPLLPAMTFVSFGVALSVVVLMRGLGGSADLIGLGTLAVLSIGLFVVVGVGLAGVVGVLAIALTAERQRLGDLWAGTWVLRRASAARPPPSGATGPPRSW